ncbi:amidase [soil metagenome]
MNRLGLAATLLTIAASAAYAAQMPPDPFASAHDQQSAMTGGQATAEALVRASMDRIKAMDRAGPRLNSILVLNPHLLADARNADRERRAGNVRGPLHGIAILLKDNIESDDDTATTAGSLALAANVTKRDAPIVRRLTDAGALILGKANLSEWANYRSTRSISGWSGVGGLVRNPYGLDRTACGSSAGSAAAVAAGFAAAAIGTETDGSITCPAAANGLVGFKPTVGLVSRTPIVPISPEPDTAGPIARTFSYASALVTVIAGSDLRDPAIKVADSHKPDYGAALDAGSLKGARIGVWRAAPGVSPQTDVVFETSLAALRKAGAVLVEITTPPQAQMSQMSEAESASLKVEFKAAINVYLASTPAAVKTRTLDRLIAFNAATPNETPLFGQEIFEDANKSLALTDPTYLANRALARRLAGPEGLDKMFKDANVIAIVGPSGGPASIVDPINGSRGTGSKSAMPAIAGYPHLTVPMGNVSGLPVGLSLIGPAWSDARILSLGYAFEQATHAWKAPTFPASIAARPEIKAAYDR